MDNRQSLPAYPHHIVCPVSFSIFFHPVTLFPGGHVVEQAYADKLIDSAHPFYPDNTTPVHGYVTAYTIQEVVEEYLTNHPDAKVDQYEPYPICNRRDSTHPLQTHVTATSKPAMSAKSQQEADDFKLAVTVQENLKNKSSHVKTPSITTNNHHSIFAPPRTPSSKPVNILNTTQKKQKDALISDIQNLIWALGFETGPQPKEIIDNFSLLFLAFFIRPDPLPWQTLKIDQGPRNDCMYWVLRSTIEALIKGDRNILERAKLEHAGQYDLVKTVFGGDLSLNAGGYVDVAKFFGTVDRQPGFLVDQLIKSAEQLLPTLSIERYATDSSMHSNSSSSSSKRY